MRWRAKPQLNELRIKTGFLFIPKCDEKTRTWRWLEFAKWEERLGIIRTPTGSYFYGWITKQWLEE